MAVGADPRSECDGRTALGIERDAVDRAARRDELAERREVGLLGRGAQRGRP
eukprot:CAMPEP_0185706258 /NCGR_PEP_ID=MMETSP1164-20130828/21597_1 /TAXON_ID=1104430 /ORGANISM="Chrysoreinhardia sp, Strain CCMP2950" /LENGTH=51 /DNA_ID=CAMNT_0028373661 /DNA_START=132 /DNA_END=284 /DNA_ORIENTATION=+